VIATPIRDYLLLLLKSLEARIPPGNARHHAMTFAQYGSDETGWSDQLAIHVWVGDKLQTVFLDESDFNWPPESLAGAIKDQVTAATCVEEK
jgi:hypothetical protein